MKIELTQKQTTAWDLLTDATTTELGYGGGARGGKSWLGAEFLNFMCLAYPETRWCIGRRQLKTLKATTLQTLFKVYKHHNLKDGEIYKYNQQDSIIYYSNGSRILLLDLAYAPSDPLNTRLGGLELTGGWIDESNEINIDVIETLQSRYGNWNNDLYGIKPISLETFNPERNHVYRRFYQPYRDGRETPEKKFIPALVTDNPHVPQSYIEKLKQRPKAIRERLLYGNFDYNDDPTKIMDYDKILDLFTNTFVETGEKFITCDPAGKGKDRTVIFVWEGWRVIHIFSESQTDQKDLRLRLLKIAEKFEVPRSNICVDYSGIGAGVTDELECKAFQGGTKAVDTDEIEDKKFDDPSFVNPYVNLRSQSWFYAAEKVQKAEAFISLESVNTENLSQDAVKDLIVEELDAMKEIQGTDSKKRIISKGSATDSPTKQTIKSILGRSPDFGDTFMMRAFFDLKSEPNLGLLFA